MKNFPISLYKKIKEREASDSLRGFYYHYRPYVDFSTNDYLGYSKNELIFKATHQSLTERGIKKNGSTGSRLLTGNSFLHETAETFISNFHKSESALIFNSGYDANVGFFSSVPQRNDIILYDEFCHASIRDGIRLSNAKSYKFKHNDLEDIKKRLNQINQNFSLSVEIYIVTESVFSMDGDSPNFEELVAISEKHNYYLIVDEAHALGVFGNNGEGLVQSLGLQDKVFARIMTFGKGLGCHGAAVLGSKNLKKYLMNFARSFIYTTALSPHSVTTILQSYKRLSKEEKAFEQLKTNITFFNRMKTQLGLKSLFAYSSSSIQCAIIPGNEKVKSIANQLQEKGFDVKAILSPTVPEGQERLRFCLHSYNSEKEISEVLQLLSTFVF